MFGWVEIPFQIFSLLCFLIANFCAGQFTTCVPRSLHRITHNNFMIDIGSRLRSTSTAWYVKSMHDFIFFFFCPFGCVIMPLETQDDDDLLFPLDLSPLKVV
jgi:hypothetical protein